MLQCAPQLMLQRKVGSSGLSPSGLFIVWDLMSCFFSVWFVFPYFVPGLGIRSQLEACFPAAVSEEMEVLQMVIPALGHMPEMQF